MGISCASPATDAGEDEGDVSCRQEEEDQEEGRELRGQPKTAYLKTWLTLVAEQQDRYTVQL